MNIYRTIFKGLFLLHAFTQLVSPDDTNSNDDDLSSLAICNNIVKSLSLTPCTFRIRLVKNYNEFRNEIASGEYYGQPTVGNMLRAKWLMSVEQYTAEAVHRCYSSAPPGINVTIQGDPYVPNYTYTCEVIYVNKLFIEWSLDEIIDYMVDASFGFNLFNDFDEKGSYKRMAIEGFGCSINFNAVAVLTIEAFMGCGFCTSPPVIEPALGAKPCSRCDPVPPGIEAIPNVCDYLFRSLCSARNSKMNQSGLDTDTFLMNVETECEAQKYLVSEKRKFIPRQIQPNHILFFKITYILPILTIGLAVYYMSIVKKQKFTALKIPKYLPSIR